MADTQSINDALWRWRSGVLEVAERLDRVKLVVGHGVILLPAPGYLQQGCPEDGTLSLPDEAEASLSLQIELRLFGDTEGGPGGTPAGLMDRWEAYHGRPVSPRFAVAAVLGARLRGLVVDESGLELVNALRNELPLLRRLNSDRATLNAGAARRLGHEVVDPVAVGVDQRGIDLRTRTGVLRIRSGARMDDAAAELFVEQLLAEGNRGA